MTLRFKRNLPLVLTLGSLLTLLVLLIGSQPIVSYTINTEALRVASITGLSSNADFLTGLYSILQP